MLASQYSWAWEPRQCGCHTEQAEADTVKRLTSYIYIFLNLDTQLMLACEVCGCVKSVCEEVEAGGRE